MSTTAASRTRRTNSRTVVEVPADHLAELATALAAFRNGDFTVRLGRRDGLLGDVVDRFNEVADLQERRTRELVRVSHVIGREGRMTDDYHPVILVMVSRIRRSSGSPGGRVCSPRAMMSLSRAIASPSRPVA